MATRAQIARFKSPIEVETIYNHFDGYPDYLGKALEDHYNNEASMLNLIKGGNLRAIDSEDGEAEHYPNEPAATIKGENLDDTIVQFAEHVDSEGGAYAYVWWKDKWHVIKNNGISGMISQLLFKLKNNSGEKEEVDELSEGWERKWENFLIENVDQNKLIANIRVLLSDEIPEQVELYIESILRDIRRGEIGDIAEMSDDDIIEDFENYIADRLDS